MIGGIVQWLFDPAGLTPHGFCLLWEPGLIWTHAISDLVIAVAYGTIPAALLVFARRRRDLVFKPLFLLFAAFIMLCGTEHLMEVLTLWVPAYGAQGAVKVATAIVSAITAVTLWRLLPSALALPSPTQLDAANEALRQSEARHRTSFERSPVPVHMLDAAGRVAAVSESWLDLLGFKSDEVIGRPIRDFSIGGWDHADLERLGREGEVRDVARRFRRKDGQVLETLISARVERANDTTWILGVVIDVTERRQAEEALRQSEERLRQAQKMDAVGKLSGGMAHDLNNMLQAISGSLELMEQRIGEGRSDKAGRYVGIARQATDRASSLTNRMLAFARRQALQPKPVDSAGLVRGMEELVSRTIGPSIELRLRLGDVCHAFCDENQLETALLNVAINARDAMPDGGTLTIEVHEAEFGATEAEALDVAAGRFIVFDVADTGVGMAPEVLRQAFEPFFTTKPQGRGTGLGLSQVYGFVRQSGGAISLQSAPGQGTVVRLCLPAHRGAVEAAAPPSPAPDLPRVRGAVLLVEDEEQVRAMLRDCLIGLGCEVTEAGDGTEALSRLDEMTRCELLITDIGLPGLNGRELAAAVRRARPDLPVLLVTGYAGAALEELSLPPGMEILRKPFKLEDFARRVALSLEAALA